MANANAITSFRQQPAGALLPDTSGWTMSYEQAQMLVKSGFLPDAIKTPEQAIAIMLTGQELGIPTMLALRSIHVIKGTPTLSADLMAALVHRAIDQHKDGEFTVLSPSASECTVRFRRWGQPEPQEFTYTIAMATTAALAGSDTWRKHPHAMLKARATATACRMAFQDVIAGLYAPEEIDADGEGVVWEARAVSEPTPIIAPVRELPQVAAMDAETPPQPKQIVNGQPVATSPSADNAPLNSLEQARLDVWAQAKALGYSWDAFNVLRRQMEISRPLDKMTASHVRMMRERLDEIHAQDEAAEGSQEDDALDADHVGWDAEQFDDAAAIDR